MTWVFLFGLLLLPNLATSHEARPWEKGYLQALRARMHGRRGRCGDDFLSDYEKARQDSKWRKKVRARRSCSKFVKLSDAAARGIEEELAKELSRMEDEPSTDVEECEEVAAEAMLDKLQKRARKPGRTLKRLMRVVTERAAASFCRGSFGLRRWLRRKASLRARSPSSYERQLQCKVRGKMSPYLRHFAGAFCGKDADDQGNWKRFRWGKGCPASDSNDAGRDGSSDDADDGSNDDEPTNEQEREEDQSGEREEFDSDIAEVTLKGLSLMLLLFITGSAIFCCGAVGLCKGVTECCKTLTGKLRRTGRVREPEMEPLTHA